MTACLLSCGCSAVYHTQQTQRLRLKTVAPLGAAVNKSIGLCVMHQTFPAFAWGATTFLPGLQMTL
jgi:hypothetical protein